jgi:Fe-S oxidoreductase
MKENEAKGDSHNPDLTDAIETSKEIVLDAASRCRNCNYCFMICPLFQSTRGFMSQTPSGILQSIKYAIKWDLLGGKEKEVLRDLVYSCTTCNGCVVRCKAKATGIPVLKAIEAGRKILREMMIGPLPQQRKPLKDLLKNGNPYGEKPEKRFEWLEDLHVKHLPREQADVLLYVGCTMSYDPELHGVGRNLLEVFDRLNIDYGILENETCCGDPALRMGDEDLFQELMEENIQRFKAAGATKIVTVSPHCFNTFSKEYPSSEKQWSVQHYVEFLLDVLKDKKAVFRKSLPYTVAYHDACYLGRHNQIYNPPRELIAMIPGIKLVEMKMKMDEALCCGGGGGRMFAEVEEEPKLSYTRLYQAIDAGADVIATACPWCFTMLWNAAKDLQLTDRIRVMDITGILKESMDSNG